MNHLIKSQFLAILALALLLIVAAPALADNTTGNLAMIDPDNHTLVLVDNDNNVLEMKFQVGGQVLINEQDATLWDLIPGELVDVTFQRTGDEILATSIQCQRAR
jgi:hypothetical protein